MARRSLYPGKHESGRVQGTLTKAGIRDFALARKDLSDLSGWDTTDISDADVIEFAVSRVRPAELAGQLGDDPLHLGVLRSKHRRE